MAKILVTSAAIRKFDLVDSGGDLNVVENALITVTDKNSGAILNLFDQNDPDSPITNPFNANADGQFAFYVEAGEIKIFAQTIVDSTLLTGSAFVSAGQGGSGTVLRLSDYVSDGATAAEVGDALEKISAEIQDGYTVDLSGNWKWGEKSLRIENKKGVTVRAGLFTKISGEAGAEYPIWISESTSCKVHSVTLDGGEAGVLFGQQGLYLRDSIDTLVSGCTFKDIGDAPIRYARSYASPPGTAISNGVSIVGNIFTNCTQVTSNNSGAFNVIISDNIFKNSAVKVTQRTEQETGFTHVTNNNFSDISLPMSIQGGFNVKFSGNTMRNCDQMITVATNQNTLGSEHIPFRNIYIEENKIFSNSALRTIYIEARDGISGDPIDCNGELHINRNEIYRDNSITGVSESTIGLFTYSLDQPLARNISVSDNEFHGEHYTLLNVGGDNSVRIIDGEISICGNENFSATTGTSFLLSINAASAYPEITFSMCKNKIYSPTFLTTSISSDFSIVRASINENEINISNASSGAFSQIVTFSGTRPWAFDFSIKNNIFAAIDNTSKDVFINANTPPSFEARRYTLTVANNEYRYWNLSGANPPRPFYCSTRTGGRQFDSLSIYGNFESEGASRPARSDNPNLSIESYMFSDSESQPIYVTFSSYQTRPNNGWRLFQTYSNGENRQLGRELLDFSSPASGNIYLFTNAPSSNYSVRFTPDLSTSTTLTHYIADQETSNFKPRVDEWDNSAKTWSSAAGAMCNYEVNWVS